jgi:hypothetical protein
MGLPASTCGQWRAEKPKSINCSCLYPHFFKFSDLLPQNGQNFLDLISGSGFNNSVTIHTNIAFPCGSTARFAASYLREACRAEECSRPCCPDGEPPISKERTTNLAANLRSAQERTVQ